MISLPDSISYNKKTKFLKLKNGMKINLALILSIIVGVGIVALGFTAFQISSEKEKLNDELKVNTIKLAEEFYISHLKALDTADSAQLQLTDSIISQYNFLGIAIYYNADSIQTFNDQTTQYLPYSIDYIAQSISADSSMTKTREVDGRTVSEYIRVVKRQDLPSIAIVFYSDAEYIQNIIK